ncbi:MAG TPA: alginate lyase family protein [Pyrinomonadaceae bacterium]|jgi:hypothetical protein
MIKKLKNLKGLKGRSLEELRVRGGQKLAAVAERAGLSSQVRTPSDETFFKLLDRESQDLIRSAEDLLQHFRTRKGAHFFAAFDNREEALEELQRRFGKEAEERVVAHAEKIMRGRFDLLGFHDLSFGDPVDWHLEPVAGKRTPLLHWSRINYLDAESAGDKKITWELNRHQYFMTLGRAYWYTGDERYAERFAAHLSEWMDRNPPKLGINWASSLEVSFRAISWLWALHFFRDSEHLKPALFLRALKFLYLHARHLETYLSTYFSPNTHLTGEALGLFYLGTLLPELRRAKSWRNLGRNILLKELDRHVLSDGVYFEQTSYYHRYTTDFYTHLFILSKMRDEQAEPLLEAKLTALLDHLMYIQRPDGTTPRFGDDDGGRLVMLDERASNDFRATLSTGAALFMRGDYKQVAGELAEETFWLLGKEGARRFDQLEVHAPAQTSQAFTEGGYYVMRDGWGRNANYLLIDCGPHGTLNCGHAHADALSFELASNGRTLLVDPGTYTYTGRAEMRDLFRSSGAHNTLVVDNESSSVPGGTFSWTHIAGTRACRWISREHLDFFEGEQDGYLRLPSPVQHTRAVFFIKNRYWIMLDCIESKGAHVCELAFHFASGAHPSIEKDAGVVAVRERELNRAGLEIFAFSQGGEWREEEGFVSEAYGACTPAPVWRFKAETKGSQEFVTFLVPRRAEDGRVHAHEIEAKGGRAIELLDGDTRDVLLIRSAEESVVRSMTSDFEWSWASFESVGNELKELALVQGRNFNLDGKELVKAEERINYLFMRRAGCDLIVETDARGRLTLTASGARRLILNNEEFEVCGNVINLYDGNVSSEERARLETFV